jgi:hypothetical protein
MQKFTIPIAVCAGLLLPLPAAFAQQLTVQQPSFETFGVGTTVSAPDRGRTSLGGVGRSAASRSMYGPLRTGTSMGLSSQGSGLSVGVRVHDLDEMDRAALQSGGKSRKLRRETSLSGPAEHAYETLQSRSRDVADERPGAIVAKTPPRQVGKTSSQASEDGPSAAKMLDRARKAEIDGKRELALTFLRAARDRGSAEAEKEIDRLSRRTR